METKFNFERRSVLAFSRVELIAILAGVVILAALVILASSHLGQKATTTRCQANLKQLFQAFQSYTSDNKGLLPDCTSNYPKFYGAAWPWDIHTNLANELQKRGIARETFYCPENLSMTNDAHWDFWRNNGSPIRVTGYLMLLNGSREVPQQYWHKDLKGDGSTAPAETELLTDATAGINGDYMTISGVFTDRSSHMNGTQPLGGNITFLDGHVAWRDYQDMMHRFTTGPGVVWDF
jgi:prepilin-type processing-associated H-X9-DG protein